MRCRRTGISQKLTALGSKSRTLPIGEQHPGIAACLNNLEHRGLGRIRSYGADGFARLVGLSIHRLGLILCGASKTVPRAA
ncbi:MAG: hypothetical protein OXC17_14295 [Aestuariivita sp.]|nr:hypothetical protein [Aestuariivita sp.]